MWESGGRRRNKAAGVACALVQQPLRLENQRVGKQKVVRDIDSVLILSLVQEPRVRLGRSFDSQFFRLGTVDPERRGDTGRSRRQRRLFDSVPCRLLGSPASWRDWDVVSVAKLSKATARQAELFGKGVKRRRPGAVVELLAGEREGEVSRSLLRRRNARHQVRPEVA